VTVGRRTDSSLADVCVPDPKMSSLHARVWYQNERWHLADLHSRNGGFLNGASFGPGFSSALEHDTVIRLGDTLALFVDTEPISGEPDDGTFPGASAEADAVRRRVRILSRSPGHVLILGETGTGKERVARAVGAPLKPFLPKNCAELSRELARSECFGHVRGAFSGATESRPGLVEQANGGVLFLDEVGELPLDVQAELLRFLEDGHYRAVGSNELRFSSARVIAATHVDLDHAVSDGRFRRDLLARLMASNRPLELPSLRERRTDILDWSLRFLVEFGVPQMPAEPWAVGFMECLLLYPWLGNLRELRGVVRGALEAHPSFPVGTSALPEAINEHRRQLRSKTFAPTTKPLPAPTREQIEAALASAGGRVRIAAQALQMNRTRLYRLCDRFDLDLKGFRTDD
jgi:DNA-binding NtrC family response regulator